MEAVMGSTIIVPYRPPQERRSVERLLAPLDAVAESSRHFICRSLGNFEPGGQSYGLPRFVYLGGKGGGDTIRIAVLATIQGDEPEGALALARFVDVLEHNPEISKGYALFFYPLCNPTGFEDNTSHSRNGKNLEQEFWRDSVEPEVRYLQSEIWMHAFDGIITLRSGRESEGFQGHAAGAILSQHLLQPALSEAERFLPRGGTMGAGNPGVLKSPGRLRHPPFEMTLRSPRSAPLHRQVDAFSAALQAILVEYRYLIAIAQNI
jgi:hypothetical protein